MPQKSERPMFAVHCTQKLYEEINAAAQAQDRSAGAYFRWLHHRLQEDGEVVASDPDPVAAAIDRLTEKLPSKRELLAALLFRGVVSKDAVGAADDIIHQCSGDDPA